MEWLYVGEEKGQNIARLNTLTQQRVKAFAGNLADEMGGIYERGGMENESAKCYQSVLQNVNDEIAAYTQYAAEHPDYVAIEDQRDEWLLKNSDYTASQLRSAAGEYVQETSQNDLYSVSPIAGFI